MFKTTGLQDITYSSKEDKISVTINSLYLFLPNLIPSVETQVMFNEATQINNKIFFDEWYTERRLISDLKVQHDIGSAQHKNSPTFLIGAHQHNSEQPLALRETNIAIFDILDLRKYYVEIDGHRYPRDGISLNYTENDYIDQHRVLKLFFTE